MTVIRPVERGELDRLVHLIREHAAFERAPAPSDDVGERLAGLVFGAAPRINVLVASADGTLVGYATWSREVSTWHAGEYGHLDCLFVQDAHRGRGVGSQLISRVLEEIARAGLSRAEWQTPDWNASAVRFYRRLGATSAPKQRFVLPISC